MKTCNLCKAVDFVSIDLVYPQCFIKVKIERKLT